MTINWKALLSTLILYIIVLMSIYLTDTLYVSKGANDITGLPFIVAILGGIILLISFVRSIYLAIKKDKSIWIVVILHIAFLGILISKFFI